MFGDEEELGSPVEDHSSMAAIMQQETVPLKLIVYLGFGVDEFHGVSHSLFLESVAAIERDGGYLGVLSVSWHTKEGQLYIRAYKCVASKMQCRHPLCVHPSSVPDGKFGDFHPTR